MQAREKSFSELLRETIPVSDDAPISQRRLSGPTSPDIESGPVTSVPVSKSGRVPGTKRQRKFERQLYRAKQAIISGDIEPKARPVAEHCQCAYRTALSILAKLTEQGVIERAGRGWSRAA